MIKIKKNEIKIQLKFRDKTEKIKLPKTKIYPRNDFF